MVWRILRWILRNVLNSLAFKLFCYTAAAAAAAAAMCDDGSGDDGAAVVFLTLTHSLVHIHSRQTARPRRHKAE